MRYSDSFVMTVHTGSAGDMLELETVRKVVKTINAKNKDAEASYGYPHRISKLPRYYVKCQGRGPRVKHAIAQGSYRRRYDQSLPLKFAEKMDVYVYQRWCFI